MNNQQPLTLTYKGETKTLQGWANTLNVSADMLRSRIRLGWPVDEVLGYVPHSIKRRPSKEEGARCLDELGFDDLPPQFKTVIAAKLKGRKGSGQKTKKYGTFLRENYNKLFTEWFEKEYLPLNIK